MKMKILRLLVFVICAFGLYWGLAREKHEVHSLSTKSVVQADGRQLIEYATYDGLMERDSKLYDIFSLGGVSAKEKDGKFVVSAEAPKLGGTKDCKT